MRFVVLLVLPLLGLSALLTGGAEDTTRSITDGKIELRIPSTWSSEIELNDVADLEVGDEDGEAYLVVLSESRSELPDYSRATHSKATLAMITQPLRESKIIHTQQLRIDGHPAVQYLVTGAMDDARLLYIHTTVETPERFHQILAWTLLSHRDANVPVLNAVIASFRES